MFDGQWPILNMPTPYTDQVYKAIQADRTGNAITIHNNYLSLGTYFLHTSLLELHPTQRKPDLNHVNSLKEDFKKMGIDRLGHPGVVIGLGNGWNIMKNTTAYTYMISPSCPHLSQLSGGENGKIGQVIRGGHRTEAVKKYAEEMGEPEAGYWAYNVLIPGI